MIHERRDGDIVVTTDKTRLDLETVHDFLSGSYWAAGIPRDVMERSIHHSICFGAFDGPRQVGFARVISDVWLSNLLAWLTRRASATDVSKRLDLAVRLLIGDEEHPKI